MSGWAENHAKNLVQEYREMGLISETQQAELMSLVAEGKASIAIDVLHVIS
jgi:hypothetical protein